MSLGAELARRLEVPGFAIMDLRFAAGTDLPPHDHQRPTIAVVVSGGFDGSYGGRETPCGASTLVVEAAGERHANRFGRRSSTRVVVLQPDASRPLAARAAPSSRPDAVPLAWRIGEELRSPDPVTPLALEGLALELSALAARDARRASSSPLPRLAAALIEERYAAPIALAAIAAELGVSAGYLAREFRRHHGRSIGAFVREVRVRRAAERLAATGDSLADVALAVGFADQSHLSRWFVRRMGVSPGRYRAGMRG